MEVVPINGNIQPSQLDLLPRLPAVMQFLSAVLRTMHKPDDEKTSTDPLGRVVKTYFDDDGRTTFQAENYVNFDPDNISTTVGGGSENDEDRVIGFTYNGVGIVKQIAYNEGEDDQETVNLYEDSVSFSRVTSTIYPDSNDTTSSGTDQVKYVYHLDGLLNTRTDQRGVVHTFEYNNRRQIELDRATTIPSGIDTAVQSMRWAYDSLGRTTKKTSYASNNGTGTIVNEVEQAFNTYGRISTEYQSHSGAVNTGTSWNVDYDYDETVSSNIFTNGLRLEKTTYDSGKAVYRDYGSSGGLNDLLSRVYQIKETGSTGTVLGEYQYNADGRLVQMTLQSVSVENSIHEGGDDGVYESWDRFGRVVKRAWEDTSSSSLLDQFQYRYDRLGNRRTKNVSKSVYSADDHDQRFVYDGLNRLTQFREGRLHANSPLFLSTDRKQEWDRDQLGNWSNFKEDEDNDGTWDTDQDREHNAANEVTSIDAISTHTAHDEAGNMTKVVKPSSNWTAHYDLKYDAWNRLVEVKDGSTVIQTNEYDGLHRRVVRDETGGSGDKVHFYYSGRQVIAEHKEVSGSEDSDPLNEYIYHPHYIDAVLCRDYDPETDGSSDRYHHLYDATYNVTASVDSNKNVVERYHYDPYGKVTILEADFSADSDNTSDIGNETHVHRSSP